MAHGPISSFAGIVAGGLRALLPSVLAGALTTVTVAWALTASDTAPRATDATFRERRPLKGEGFGRLILEWTTRPGVVRYDAWVYPTCVSTYAAGPRSPEEVVPRWASAIVLPWLEGRRPWPRTEGANQRTPSAESTHIEAAGWPLAALWRDCGPVPPPGTAPPPAAMASTAAASVAQTAASVLAPGRIFPHRPIWSGLAVDTLLYATIWWGLLALPRVVLLGARFACGRCTGCGYDLAGLPSLSAARVRCPECGGLCRAPRGRTKPPALAPAI